MPHRCMNCGKEYDEDADELIEGCECGSTLFLYEKNPDQEVKDDEVLEEVDKFLKSVKGEDKDSNVVFDPGSITVEEEGVYNINLKKLLDEEPLIVEVKNNRYYLHLASLFNKDGKFSKNDLRRAEDGD